VGAARAVVRSITDIRYELSQNEALIRSGMAYCECCDRDDEVATALLGIAQELLEEIELMVDA
jgi:hypothetical protein